MRLGLVIVAVLATLVPYTAHAQGNAREVADRASKAVVAFNHQAGLSRRGNPFDNQARTAGFLISSEGHIVTALRFVEGRARLDVQLFGGARARAELIGTDPLNRIALLKLQSPDAVAKRFGGKIPHLSWGQSSKLVRGQTVFTLGNAFDSLILDGTPSFSKGVVTAIERVREGQYRGVAIETDAAVNPGSFGGPLLDSAGRVVGVVCPTFSARRWLGQAVPGDQVRRSVEAMLADKKPAHGLLGVRLKVTGGEASKNGLQVTEVQPGSSAANAGIRVGDTLRSIDGVRLYDTADAARELQHLAPGSPVTLQISSGGTLRTVTAILGRGAELVLATLPRPGPTRPTPQVEARPQRLRKKPSLGVRVEERDDGRLGLVVTEVTAGSKAEKAKIQVGDIIMAVDRRRLNSLDDLRAALTRELRRPTMRLVVLRKRRLLTLSIPLELAEAPRPKPSTSATGYLGVFLDPEAKGPGARVDGAEEGSPAARAGLRKGDTIVAVGGRTIRNTQALIAVLGTKRAGDTLQLTVRRAGWTRKIGVKLVARGETAKPTPKLAPKPDPRANAGWLGVGLVEDNGRVVVSEIAPNGPSVTAGVLAGDKILSIDGHRILTIEDASRWLGNKTVGQTVRLQVERNGWTKFLNITLAKRP